LLPRRSWVQIFSSAPYSQTPSGYVPPSMWATKFHTIQGHRKEHHDSRTTVWIRTGLPHILFRTPIVAFIHSLIF
jgi:hypothetical protein